MKKLKTEALVTDENIAAHSASGLAKQNVAPSDPEKRTAALTKHAPKAKRRKVK